ncbi:hypothetical protein ACK3TF_005770 [Chlorella vulgaris]
MDVLAQKLPQLLAELAEGDAAPSNAGSRSGGQEMDVLAQKLPQLLAELAEGDAAPSNAGSRSGGQEMDVLAQKLPQLLAELAEAQPTSTRGLAFDRRGAASKGTAGVAARLDAGSSSGGQEVDVLAQGLSQLLAELAEDALEVVDYHLGANGAGALLLRA